MAIAETLVAVPPPLELKEEGRVLRVRGTRISLDAIVDAHEAGMTPPEIAERYSTVRLADVYAVIGYYLAHKSEVSAYLERRRRQAEEIWREIETHQGPSPTREELLSRLKSKGQ